MDPTTFRGQDQGPRTQTQVLINKKKGLQKFFSGEKGLQKFFFRLSVLKETKKKVFADFPQGFWRFQRNFNGSKIVLSSSR